MSDLHRPDDSAHPDDALAGYVDGTLTAAERADVQAHLDGCARCRAEVAQAGSALRALRSLPELDAPWGLGREAIEEARRGLGRVAHPQRSSRVAWVAGVAAAVVLVAGLSVAVLRAPQGGTTSPASARAPATSGAQPQAGGSVEKSFATNHDFIQHSSHDFSTDDVSRLARDTSADMAHRVTAPTAPLASSAPSTPAGGATTSGPTPEPETADSLGPVACLDTAAEYSPATKPIHVIDARYEEKPALIGIFLQASSPAGRNADLVVIWVASKADCQVLSYASSTLSP